MKVCLHSAGEDVETPWAEDLGEAPDKPGARLVRLANVPFLHAKPTYEDVVVVEYDSTYNKLTWDRGDLPFERISERIAEDAGRYAVILDYHLCPPDPDPQAAFAVLDRICANVNVSAEGCFGPQEGRPGRVYLAVPNSVGPATVLAYLEKQKLAMTLTLVHPL